MPSSAEGLARRQAETLARVEQRHRELGFHVRRDLPGGDPHLLHIEDAAQGTPIRSVFVETGPVITPDRLASWCREAASCAPALIVYVPPHLRLTVGALLEHEEIAGQVLSEGLVPHVDPREEAAGEVISDRFEVLGELGCGSGAPVLRVRDLHGGGREVALKRLDASEGPGLNGLPGSFPVHPNLVSVLEVLPASAAGGPAILMECVEGRPLSRWLEDLPRSPSMGKILPAAVVHVLADCLRGLLALHGQGIAHGDVKPSNLLIVGDPLASKGATKGSPLVLWTDYGMSAPDTSRRGAALWRDLTDLVGMWEYVLSHEVFRRAPGDLGQEVLREVARLLRDIVRVPRGGTPRRLRSLLAKLEALDPEGRDAAWRPTIPSSVALLGRKKELARMDSWLEGRLRPMGGGMPPLLALRGPAGAGRRRLLTELAWVARRRDVVVLCLEAGWRPPIWRAMTDLLAPRPRATQARGGARGAVAAAGEILASLVERNLFLQLPPLADLAGEDAAFLEHLLHSLEHRPPEGRGLSLLLAADPADEGIALVDRLHAGGLASCVDLAPLSPGESASLARAFLSGDRPSATLLRQLTKASGGWPGPLRETLVAVAAEGLLRRRMGRVEMLPREGVPLVPATVETSVRRRLALLGPEALDVLAIACLGGGRLSAAATARAAQIAPAAVVLHVVELRRMGLVDWGGGCAGPTAPGDYVVGTVLSYLAPQHVARLASRILQEMDPASADPILLADLWSHTVEDAGYVTAELEAAKHLMTRGAPGRAVLRLGGARERALRTSPRKRRAFWDCLEKAAREAGQPRLALEAMDARDAEGGRRSRRDQGERDLARANLLMRSGRLDDAEQTLVRAEDHFAHSRHIRGRFRAQDHRAFLAYLRGRAEECLALVGDPPRGEEAASIGNAVLGSLHNTAALALLALGRPSAAEKRLRRAVQLRLLAGDAEGEAGSWNNLSQTLYLQGRLREARAAARKGLRIARSVGSEALQAQILNNLGAILARCGEIGASDDAFAEALQFYRLQGIPSGTAKALHNLGTNAVVGGRFADAARLFHQALLAAETTNDPVAVARTLERLASIAVMEGELEDASRWMERLDRCSTGEDEVFLGLVRARYLSRMGRSREARAAHDALRARVAEQEVHRVHLALLDAELSLAQGDVARAYAALEDGRPGLSRADTWDRLQHARWSVHVARRRGRLSDAQRLARMGIRECRKAGAAGIEMMLRHELGLATGTLPKRLAHLEKAFAPAARMGPTAQTAVVAVDLLRTTRQMGIVDRGLEILDERLGAMVRDFAEEDAQGLAHWRALRELVAEIHQDIVRAREALPEGLEPSSSASSLAEAVRSFVADPASPHLLDRILEGALTLSEAERGMVAVGQNGKLSFAATRRDDGEEIPRPSQKLSRKAAEVVFRTGRPLVSGDAPHDEALRDAVSIRSKRILSLYCAPLLFSGQRLGVFYLDHRHRKDLFPPEKQRLLEAFASLAAAALETQRVLVREAEEKGVRLPAAPAPRDVSVSTPPATPSGGRESLCGIVGRSAVMQEIFAWIEAVAPREHVTVLLEGETGTGKELVARALHRLSSRSEGPLVAVNAGAFAEGLLESELFGCVRGAYTGAHEDRIGLIESAERGTFFLDEIGDMSAAMQLRFLRFLEDGIVRRVGSTRERRVSVRVIAATNRSLARETESGRFRKDLLYRVRGLHVCLPPLRERGEDIPLLFFHFLEQAATANGLSELPDAPSDILELLQRHPWPGNVRELRNLAEAVCVERVLRPQVVEMYLRAGTSTETLSVPLEGTLKEATSWVEAECIRNALRKTQGNRRRAAELLGISSNWLITLLRRHKIS